MCLFGSVYTISQGLINAIPGAGNIVSPILAGVHSFLPRHKKEVEGACRPTRAKHQLAWARGSASERVAAASGSFSLTAAAAHTVAAAARPPAACCTAPILARWRREFRHMHGIQADPRKMHNDFCCALFCAPCITCQARGGGGGFFLISLPNAACSRCCIHLADSCFPSSSPVRRRDQRRR